MSIIGGNSKGYIPCRILVACALAAQFACAMPSEREIRRVQPMVLELMSPHEKNFDAKKETAKEVGDAAVGLADVEHALHEVGDEQRARQPNQQPFQIFNHHNSLLNYLTTKPPNYQTT